MLVFSQSKINLGLTITGRLDNGYHTLRTVMVPIAWGDIIEAVPAETTTLTITGREVNCPIEKNLVMRAYRALEAHTGGGLRPLNIYMRKIVPDGAGLGGGSGDASAMLRLINDLECLDFDDQTLASIAAGLGADCPFFIYNQPMLATGIGTELTPIDIPQLEEVDVLVVKPPMTVSTAEAYAGIDSSPLCPPPCPIEETLSMPISSWRDLLVNDFEPSVFAKLPELAAIKSRLYDLGAIYASMSGSGSALYGLFPKGHLPTTLPPAWSACAIWPQ